MGTVLLHGAGLGGWIWDAVVPQLSGPVVAIDRHQDPELSRTDSLEACVDRVLAKVDGWDDVVVVGHSVSGAVALSAASRLGSRARAVVLVGAVVPPSGSTYLDTLPFAQRWFLKALFAWAPQGLAPPDKVLASALCNDLDDATTARVLERSQVPFPSLFQDPVTWSLHPSTARHYVVLTHDASDLTPAIQRQFALRLQAEITEVDSGHLPMISQPDALAAVLRGV